MLIFLWLAAPEATTAGSLDADPERPLWELMGVLVSATVERCEATWKSTQAWSYLEFECVDGVTQWTTRQGSRTNYDVSPMQYVQAYPMVNGPDLVVVGKETQSWWEVNADGGSNQVSKVYDQFGPDRVYTEIVSTNPFSCAVTTQIVNGVYLTNFCGSAARPHLDWGLMDEVTRTIVNLTHHYIDVSATTARWDRTVWTNSYFVWQTNVWVERRCREVIHNDTTSPRRGGGSWDTMSLGRIFEIEGIGTNVKYVTIVDRGGGYPQTNNQVVYGWEVGAMNTYQVTNQVEIPRFYRETNVVPMWTYQPAGRHADVMLATLVTTTAIDQASGLPAAVRLTGFTPESYDGHYQWTGEEYEGPGGTIRFVPDDPDQLWGPGRWVIGDTINAFRFDNRPNWFFLSLFGADDSDDFPMGCPVSLVAGYTAGVASVHADMTAGVAGISIDEYDAKKRADTLFDGYGVSLDVTVSDLLARDCENTNAQITCADLITGPFTVTVAGRAMVPQELDPELQTVLNVTSVVQVTGCGSYELPDYYSVTSITTDVGRLPSRGLVMTVRGAFTGAVYNVANAPFNPRGRPSRLFTFTAIDERIRALRHLTHTAPAYNYVEVEMLETNIHGYFEYEESGSFELLGNYRWPVGPYVPAPINSIDRLTFSHDFVAKAVEELPQEWSARSNTFSFAAFKADQYRGRLRVNGSPALGGHADVWYFYEPDGVDEVYYNHIFQSLEDPGDGDTIEFDYVRCGMLGAEESRYIRRWSAGLSLEKPAGAPFTLSDPHDINDVVGYQADYYRESHEFEVFYSGGHWHQAQEYVNASGVLWPSVAISWDFDYK